MRGHIDAAADDTGETGPLTMAGPLTPLEFVRLAIDLAVALDDWHRNHGPHTALSPDVIRIGPSGAVRLVAGPAGAAPGGVAPAGAGPDGVAPGGAGPAGPLSAVYAAPEQSGRLERGVDERTDLYALGVLYYRMLGGRLPFDADTPAQWRHCHLVERPRPLADLVPALPPALGEIVTLLLEKSPDDRYQTARGLAADLERCRDALTAGEAASRPLLRTRDLPDRLSFTGRLHGREKQLSRLQAAYDRVAAGGPAELVAVTAHPGLGRWATVANFADAIVTAGGRSLRAGCAPDDGRPYAAIARLLTDLADQLSDAPAEQRSRIADAVAGCGAALTELVPALRVVFGDPPPPDGSPATARHRLQLATRRLLGAVTAPGRPLVIAIRDLQWADEPTIDLLRYVLAAPDAPAVLVVVTYRTSDVGLDHPLQALLRDERVTSASVALRPLPDSALAGVLAETLGVGMREASWLARTVASRTGSNPLLVTHYLRALADQGLLAYSADGVMWQWQHHRVDSERPAADVTALVHATLARLPAGLRDLLGLAAVLGPSFDAATLTAAAARSGIMVDGTAGSPTRMAALLRPAVRAMLVAAGARPGEYRWRHEHLRQAVLAALDEPRRAELRLAVGLTLAPQPERLFEAVAALNAAAGLLTLADERRRLAELNLAAGRRAVRVGAVAEACGYLRTGLALLGDEAWRAWPDLTFRLHVESAEAERAAGGYEAAERLLDAAAARVDDPLDRARLLGARAALRRDAGDETDALRIAIEALDLLGVRVPADPAAWRGAGQEATERLRRDVDEGALDALTQAPYCTEPWVVLASDLIADLAQPIWPDRDGRDLLAAVGVELAVAHGPTATTAYLLCRLAAVLADRRQDTDTLRFAGAGLRLLERPGTRYAAVTRATAAVLGPCWLDGPTPMIRELYAAYRTAVEDGEVRLAQRIGAVYSVHLFAVGTPLDQVAADVDARWRFAQRHGVDEAAGAVNRLLEGAVGRLRPLSGRAPAPTAGEDATRLRIVRGEYRYYTVIGVSPLLAPAYLFDDADDVAALDDVIGRVVTRSPSTFLTAEAVFWHAFSLVQRCENTAPEQRDPLYAELAALQDRLDDLADRGPVLLRARALLLSAERARLAGDAEQARVRYDRAIVVARESDFIRSEGFAAERGGRHALACGEVGDAVAYLRRARACYQQWGAETKLDQLDELLAAASRPVGASRALDQLDLLTVVRAFRSISGELRLDRLVGVLLELLVRHSSAERGCLLLAEGTELRPAAEAEVRRDGIHVNADLDGDASGRLPIELLEYAGRSRTLLAGGPDELLRVAADRYLTAHRPRSALCAPIARGDTLLAVLYLEHRRLAAAFSHVCLDLLDVLCTQAAIALENASVHARLAQTSKILDIAFDRMPDGLVLLGPDLTVRRVSPGAVEIMGMPVAPGTPLDRLVDVLAPTDPAGVPYRYAPGWAAEPGWMEPVDRETTIVTPEGGRRPLTVSAIPLRDETGGLVGVAVLMWRA